MFITSEQLQFLFIFSRPGLHIFPYFIYAFLRQHIFIICFFSFCGFGFVNEFVNEFYLPVYKPFHHKRYQEITACKNDGKADKTHPPFLCQIPDQQADRHGQYQCCKSSQLTGGNVFSGKHDTKVQGIRLNAEGKT